MGYDSRTNIFDRYTQYATKLFTEHNESGSEIDSSYIVEEGRWISAFMLIDVFSSSDSLSPFNSNYPLNTDGSFPEIYQERYGQFHFRLTVAIDEDFDNIVLVKNSEDSQVGWEHETRYSTYNNITDEGVSTSYIGRIVRYISQIGEELERSMTYYMKIQQWDIVAGTAEVEVVSEAKIINS